MMTSATAPIGRLTKKTQCQPTLSVRKPPSAGPMRALMPKTAPNRPWYLPRSARGEEVADDRQRDREDGAGAEALQAAGSDELPHLLREAGERRADQEEADADHDHRSPPELVGELAVDRPADGGGRAGRS